MTDHTNNPISTTFFPGLSLVCPCFNEEENIDAFTAETYEVLSKLNLPYEIIFINDGSTDNTLEKLLMIKNLYHHVRILNLSRNFGKEAALSAGLDYAKGEIIIPIDTDLQHPPHVITLMIDKWREGYDVVLAKRKNRVHEHFIKKSSANFFYKIHNKITHIDIPNDVGDFRLITRKVLAAIQKLPENQRFMKGIFAWVGFKPAVVEYEVRERHAGNSAFNFWKLWNFALDGITSFSTVPLRIWFYIGLFVSCLSLVYGSVIVLKTLLFGIDTPGYTSMITVTLFIGGIQLIGIGILGEYIGRIYMESKRRPTYIIEHEY